MGRAVRGGVLVPGGAPSDSNASDLRDGRGIGIHGDVAAATVFKSVTLAASAPYVTCANAVLVVLGSPPGPQMAHGVRPLGMTAVISEPSRL